MKRWNELAALWRQKGLITAVFTMSFEAIGNWWYARTGYKSVNSPIWDRDLIKGTVVSTRSPVIVFLRYPIQCRDSRAFRKSIYMPENTTFRKSSFVACNLLGWRWCAVFVTVTARNACMGAQVRNKSCFENKWHSKWILWLNVDCVIYSC